MDLFYRLYDAAGGKADGPEVPPARDYIKEGGTDGVRQFVPDRILSGEELAKTVAANAGALYDNARKCRCRRYFRGAHASARHAFAKLARLYPEARFPPVTLVIGRNNSGGTTGKSGVLIGLEVVLSHHAGEGRHRRVHDHPDHARVRPRAAVPRWRRRRPSG